MADLSQFVNGGGGGGGSQINSIQRGTTFLDSPVTFAQTTITAVDTTKTEVNFLGLQTNGVDRPRDAYVRLLNSTTLDFRGYGEGASSSIYDTTISWEVIEYV